MTWKHTPCECLSHEWPKKYVYATSKELAQQVLAILATADSHLSHVESSAYNQSILDGYIESIKQLCEDQLAELFRIKGENSMPEDEKTPEVQEITFPHTNVQIAKEGLLITNYLSPTFVTNQQLSPATLDAIVAKWQELKQELSHPTPEFIVPPTQGIITPLKKGGKRHLN